MILNNHFGKDISPEREKEHLKEAERKKRSKASRKRSKEKRGDYDDKAYYEGIMSPSGRVTFINM